MLGAILFAISVIGIFLNRRNVIIMLMAIELMLLAVNLNFIAFCALSSATPPGQMFVFFILTVAAAESAIGLAILVLLFRNVGSIDVEELRTRSRADSANDHAAALPAGAARAARRRDRRRPLGPAGSAAPASHWICIARRRRLDRSPRRSSWRDVLAGQHLQRRRLHLDDVRAISDSRSAS